MPNKKPITRTCSRSSLYSYDHDKHDRKELSVISENEFNDSNTDIEDESVDDNLSNNESIEHKLRKHDVSKPSIVTRHRNVMKVLFDKISSMTKFKQDKICNHELDSTSFLSKALEHLNDFVLLTHNIYWADKLLLELTNCQMSSFMFQAILPQENIFLKYNGKKSMLAALHDITVTIPNDDGFIQKTLPRLHSIPVSSVDADKNGLFINTGSCVSNICWASIHPDLHRDQYLAACVNGDLDAPNEINMIQLYRCDLSSAAPPELEYLLVHNWGKVTDMCWCPQPLPVIARQVSLIGHLALACTDGFVRILPMTRRGDSSNIVTVAPDRPLLCLGPRTNILSKGTFPTCVTWCHRSVDRIVVGYNSGQIGMYVLDSSVLQGLTAVVDGKIHVQPVLLRRVFPDSVKSVQVSPNDPYVVASTSNLSPHALLVDFSQKGKGHTNIDSMGIVGASLVWPDPGDFVTIVGGLNPCGPPGLIFGAVHKPAKKCRKVTIKNVSVAAFNAPLNVIPVGTRLGKLFIVPVPSMDMTRPQRKSLGSKTSSEWVIKSKFYHQYKSVPVYAKKESSPTVKHEHGPSERLCVCPASIHCVHRLTTDFSISVSKEEDSVSPNWQMLNVNGVAVNPNPVCCAWMAASLNCGLIHLFPLAPHNDSDRDRLEYTVDARHLKETIDDFFVEALLPLSVSLMEDVNGRRWSQGRPRTPCTTASSRNSRPTRNKAPSSVSDSIQDYTKKCCTPKSGSRESSDGNQCTLSQCTKLTSWENSCSTNVSIKRTTKSSVRMEDVVEEGTEARTDSMGRKMGEATKSGTCGRENTFVGLREPGRVTRSTHAADVVLLRLADQKKSVEMISDCGTVTRAAKRSSNDTTENRSGHAVPPKRSRKTACLREKKVPIVCLEDIMSMNIQCAASSGTDKGPLTRVFCVDIDSEVDMEQHASAVQSTQCPDNADIAQLPPHIEETPMKIVIANCVSSADVTKCAVKASDSVTDKYARRIHDILDRSSSFVNASWWDSDTTRVTEDHSLDVSNIDDLSIVRSAAQSSKCKDSGIPSREDELKKIQTILSKGILQVVPWDSADPSPQLLQPFHSLKFNKTSDQWG